MDVSATKPATKRLDWLDALRGWAVLGVVAVHSSEVAHSRGLPGLIAGTGQYGVQLFFLVSALTISLTYDSHIRQFGRSFRSQCAWLLKRFFRIAPLYYFAALFYPIEQYVIYRASHHRYGSLTAIPNILANLLFVHTWIPSANNSVVPGGWSIGVEMFFYLLVPFIWMVAPVRKRIAVLAGAGALCLACTFAVSRLTTGSTYVVNNSFLYYWFPTQAPVIAIGLIFYFLRGSNLHQSHGKRQAASGKRQAASGKQQAHLRASWSACPSDFTSVQLEGSRPRSRPWCSALPLSFSRSAWSILAAG